MSEEQDKIFFRNFSLVVAGIAVMMVLFYVAAQFVVPDDEASSEKVAEMTAPAGQVNVEGQESAESVDASVETATAPAASADAHPGQAVYDGLCVNCHGVPAMASMIPQTGDAAAWEARIAKGTDVLYENAINGFVGDMGMMPGKGGNLSLSDDEVKAAVDYMIVAVSSDATDSSAATEEPAADATTDIGQKVHAEVCANCHGIAELAAMIPQTGDAAAWEARVAKGVEVLYDHAINGFVGDMGMMPGKGGNLDLSDDEVKAAVDYMVKQVQ